MRVELPSQHEGYWWLDASPDRRLPGFLETTERHVLTVVGNLADPEATESSANVIHGLCNGQRITLVEVSERFGVRRILPDSTSTYYCPIVLFCDIDLTGHPIKFDKLDLTLDRMEVFAARSGLTLSEAADETVLTHSPLPSLTAVDANGRHYTLDGAVWTEHNQRVSHWREQEILTIELPLALSVPELLQIPVGSIQHLLHLASGYPARILDLRVSNRSRSTAGISPWATVVVYRGSTADQGEGRRVASYDYLLTLGDLPFDEIIPRWMELVQTLGVAIDILFSLNGPNSGFVSTRLLNAAAAAEGIHRRLNSSRETPTERQQTRITRILACINVARDRKWLAGKLSHSHRLTLAARLRELRDEGGLAFQQHEGDPTKWVAVIVRLRDMVAHSLDDIERRPAALHRLGSMLDLLLRIVLLRRLGLSEDVLRHRLARHMQWSYLRDALEKDVPEIF